MIVHIFANYIMNTILFPLIGVMVWIKQKNPPRYWFYVFQVNSINNTRYLRICGAGNDFTNILCGMLSWQPQPFEKLNQIIMIYETSNNKRISKGNVWSLWKYEDHSQWVLWCEGLLSLRCSISWTM